MRCWMVIKVELRYRRASSRELDLIMEEAEKYGKLTHELFGVVEGRFRDVYAINENVWNTIESMKIKPYAFGTFVGTIKVDAEKFYPNIEFFYFVNVERNYAVLKPRSAFMFTTGKGVFREGVREYRWKGSRKLVILDENGIVLGLGLIQRNFIKNITDVGEFLRRHKS